jgi:GntR family transcriptional regulator
MKALLKSMQAEWAQMQRNTDSRVPLYHQLYSLLKDAILEGRINFNEQMPTEQQLIASFNVSRITAKRAMDELAAEKLVTRLRGKGSHVIYRYEPKPLRAPLLGLLDNFAQLAIHSTAKVLSIERVVPPASVRRELSLGDTDTALRIVRVHSNEDGVVYSHYVSWTPGAGKGFTKRNLERTSRLKLLRQSGIEPARIEQILGAEAASVSVAAALNIIPGTALLSLKRISYDKEGRCVDVVFGLYNPKLFKYTMELTGD